MTEPTMRPIPGDPGGAEVAAMFTADDAEWLVSAEGSYSTGAAECMTWDGGNYQRVVLLEWPARVNRSTETRTIRLMISPEDAVGLAKVLLHTAAYLLATDRGG